MEITCQARQDVVTRLPDAVPLVGHDGDDADIRQEGAAETAPGGLSGSDAGR